MANIAAGIALGLGMVSWFLTTPPEGAPGKVSPASPSSGAGGVELASSVKPGSSGTPLGSSSAGGIDDGLEWAKSLPRDPKPGDTIQVVQKLLWDRNRAIFEAVRQGGARIDWTSISTGPITVPIFARTMRIGRKNSVRVSVDYETMQAIADLLNCSMLTSKLTDLSFAQATAKLAPAPRLAWVEDGTMAFTKRMVEYSLQLDEKVSPDDVRLVGNEGKQWVVSLRFWNDPEPAKRYPPNKRSANYGWLTPNGPLQSVGLVHNFAHVDYSQQVILCNQWLQVGAKPMHIRDVLADKTLAPLISYDGMLPFNKHPYFKDHPPALTPGGVSA